MTTEAIGHDPLIGQTLGHYRIMEKIGSGGMGVVYQAHDEHLDREVAIKVLPLGTLADGASRRRFRNEALTLSKLNHPNIATIYDFDTQQGLDFLVMEYIPGVTLNDKIAGASLPENQVLALGTQLAEGLSVAHERAVVHRDLKPGNLRIIADGRLKILDFGLAKLRASAVVGPASETLSETHTIAGTLPYMAPEQVLGGEIDARTDIHAAGAVLYEMATGQRAFPAVEHSQLTSAILRSSPRPADSVNPRLSSELARIIGKCLEREPENRYQSAKELVVDLRRLQRGGASGVQTAARWARWRSLKSIGVSLAVVASVVVLLFAFNLGHPRDRLFGKRGAGAPAFAARDWLLITDFENRSGEALFDDTVTQSLAHALQQSRYVDVVPRAQAVEAARLTGRSDVSHLDSQLGQQLCQRENYRAFLAGDVVKAGAGYQINVRFVDPVQNVPVLRDSVLLRSPNDLYDAVDELAKRLRGRLGESVAQIEQQSTPQARVTTPSLEALRRYSAGMNRYAAGDIDGFLTLARSAVDLDPDFAMAHLSLAQAYNVLGNEKESRIQLTQALKGIGRVSERERYLIRATNYSALWLDEKSLEQYRLLIELYPDDIEGLQGFAQESMFLGHMEDAIQTEKHVLQINPHSARDHSLLIRWLARVNKPSEALAAYSAATERGVNSPILHWGAGLAYLGQDEPDEAQQQFALLAQQGSDYEKALSALYSARVLMYQGRLRQATHALRTSLLLDEKLHYDTWIPVHHYLLFEALRSRGRMGEAREEWHKMATATPQPSTEDAELRWAGQVAIDMKDLGAARQLLARLAKLNETKEDGITRSYYYNLKGAVELAEGKTEAAIESQERSVVAYPFYGASDSLAAAYAAERRWPEAVENYKRYLDHKGDVMAEDAPSAWVLGNLRMAQTLEQARNFKEAVKYYDEFLRLWANADSDLPALRQAKEQRGRAFRAISSERNTEDAPNT